MKFPELHGRRDQSSNTQRGITRASRTNGQRIIQQHKRIVEEQSWKNKRGRTALRGRDKCKEIP